MEDATQTTPDNPSGLDTATTNDLPPGFTLDPAGWRHSREQRRPRQEHDLLTDVELN